MKLMVPLFVGIDGHTRVKAAELAGRHFVPHAERDFKDEEEALAYAIHNQRNRRNMTEADLLRCIEAVDKRREQKGVTASQDRDTGGRFKPLPPHGGNGGKSAEAVDKRKDRGGDHGNQYTGKVAKTSSEANGKSSKKTAEIVGTSQAKVERARRVASPEPVGATIPSNPTSRPKVRPVPSRPGPGPSRQGGTILT